MNSSTNQSEMSEHAITPTLDSGDDEQIRLAYEQMTTRLAKQAAEELERLKKEKAESDDDSDDEEDARKIAEDARKNAEDARKIEEERRAEKKKKKAEEKKISTLIASIEEDKRVKDEKEQLYIQECQERDKVILLKEEALRALYEKQFEEKKPNPVKLTGVTQVGEKWKASCTSGGKSKYIGTYNTEREAAEGVDSFHRRNGTTPQRGFNYGN